MATRTWPILRYRLEGFESREDPVVGEVPLTLYLNGDEVVTLLSLGDHPLELALGFLRSEGLVATRDDVCGWREEPGAVWVETRGDTATLHKLFGKRTVTTGCGKGTTFYATLDALRTRPVASAARFAPEAVLRRMGELQRRSDLYRETGGTHNASLADDRATLCFRTDIGRHNAVDMLGGRALLDGMDLSGTMLLSTGRISSEILIKAAKMGVPVLVSRSAPTALALELAEQLRVTAIGYARNGRFNIYTHPERIAGALSGLEHAAGEGDGQQAS